MPEVSGQHVYRRWGVSRMYCEADAGLKPKHAGFRVYTNLLTQTVMKWRGLADEIVTGSGVIVVNKASIRNFGSRHPNDAGIEHLPQAVRDYIHRFMPISRQQARPVMQPDVPTRVKRLMGLVYGSDPAKSDVGKSLGQWGGWFYGDPMTSKDNSLIREHVSKIESGLITKPKELQKPILEIIGLIEKAYSQLGKNVPVEIAEEISQLTSQLEHESKDKSVLGKEAAALLMQKVSSEPLAFATLLLPMFEPLATGSSTILDNPGIRENLQRRMEAKSDKFTEKNAPLFNLFQQLLDGVIEKYPNNSLGGNVKQTSLEALQDVRQIASYLQSHASEIEGGITNKKKLDIPNVNPALVEYIQGLLEKLYVSKNDASKQTPWVIQQASTYKGILGAALRLPGAVTIGARVIEGYLAPLFTNPPLTSSEKEKVHQLIRSALQIAIDLGLTKSVFDFLDVIVEHKGMAVQQLIEQSMPKIIKFLDIFEYKVVQHWKLDDAVDSICVNS